MWDSGPGRRRQPAIGRFRDFPGRLLAAAVRLFAWDGSDISLVGSHN